MRSLAIDGGGEADLVALDGERATLASTAPVAPGAPLGATILATGTRVRIKVAWCKKTGDGFEIAGRLVDATRAIRSELATLIRPS